MKKALALLLVIALTLPMLMGCSSLPWSKEPSSPTTPPQGVEPTQPPSSQPTSGAPMPTAAIPTEGSGVSTVAARVNGQEIDMAVFQKQFFQFKVALTDQDIDLSTEEGQAAMAQVRTQVLNSLIELALIEQAAARMNISVTDDQVNAKVQETIAAGGSTDKFQAWLQESGITEAEFADQLRAEMLTDEVIRQVTSSVPDTAEQVHARHILVGSEQKAQEALRRVQSGEDFAKVATEMSEDDVSRDQGGDLGWFPKGMLSVPVEVEDAAFALQPNQVSGVVRSPYGYHVIQVVERDQARALPAEVHQIMKQKAFDQWLQQQRASAQIEILVPME